MNGCREFLRDKKDGKLIKLVAGNFTENLPRFE